MKERMPMIGLEPLMSYTVRTAGPLDDTVGAPGGRVQYWEVSEAKITGPGLSLSLAKPGSDLMSVGEDGRWRPDVRLAMLSDRGEVVLLHYTGLVERSDEFMRAAERDGETGFDDQYMRVHLRFETGAERLAWLVRSLWIADGRLLGTGRIEYRIHRVT